MKTKPPQESEHQQTERKQRPNANEALLRLRQLRGRVPRDFVFDRLEAHVFRIEHSS